MVTHSGCLLVVWRARSLEYVALLVVLEPGRRPALEAHAQHEPMTLQHFLDLGERLLAEVRRAQQLDLGALNEITDVVDVLGLQAVRAAHGELELIDRPQQNGIELHLGDLGRGFLLALQIHEHRQLVLKNPAGAPNGLSASIVPLVSMSITSLSRSVRCSTR